MKAKMLLLALVVLGTTMVYSASPEKETKTDCEKKVLKQIKRKLENINFMDYVPSGQKARLLVTYVVNQNNIVEITGIEGAGEEFSAAITDRMKKQQLKCETLESGEEYSFILTFKHVEL